MSRIVSISRVVSNLTLAEQFYVEVLGFARTGREACSPDLLRELGCGGGANQSVLRLGDEFVNLVQYETPTTFAAPETRSDDLWFQHIAIVVRDMELAHEALAHFSGWHAITECGPQKLPASDGGVRAFKFTGPDGHPFELIWFPPSQGREVWQQQPGNRLFLGIDHTAISIAATKASVEFYTALGFQIENQTLNVGPKQSLLDAIPGALVDVTAMRLASPLGMGIELLRYHPHGRKLIGRSPKSLVTDWITIESPTNSPVPEPTMLEDPDGHRVAVNLR